MNGCTECKVEPWMDHRSFWWTVPDAVPCKYCEGSQGAEAECMCKSMRVKCGQGVKHARTFSSFIVVRSGLGLEV